VAFAGFCAGAWRAGPEVTWWSAAAATCVGTAAVVAVAASWTSRRVVRGNGGASVVAVVGTAVATACAWTAVGFGLSGVTHVGYGTSRVVEERRVTVVGTVVAESAGAGFGRGIVLRVSGGRLAVSSTVGQIRAPVGTTLVVSGTLRPLGGDERSRDRMRRSRVGGRLAADDVRVRSPPPWPAAAAAAARRHLRDAATFVGGGDRSAVLLGLLTGDDGDLAPSTRRQFREAGMSHLMAVSGSNLAVVAGGVAVFVSFLPLDRRVRIVIVAVALVAYVLVTRGEPSVVRAAVTAGVALVAAWRGVLRDAARAFPTTVLGIAVCDPWIVDAVGFQLSVVATGGILYGAAPIARRLPPRLPLPARVAVAVTVAAQLAVLPLSAWHFGALPLAGFVANLPAVPVAEAITLSGAVLAPLSYAVPEVFVVLIPLLDTLRWCARVFAAVPYASVPMQRAAVVGLTVATVATTVAVRYVRGRYRVSSDDADG
jgi:competence protein ComEC